MRFRILAGAVIMTVVAGVATLTVRGASRMDLCCIESHACCDGDHGCCKKEADTSASLTDGKQWAIVNFTDTIRVNGRFVAGPVLIVHDLKKMADGQPCTTFYRFDPAEGPKAELVSFHCIPRRAQKRLAETMLKTVTIEPGVKTLVEYQIAGDNEAHGIPR
jgi:hypothetical protein